MILFILKIYLSLCDNLIQIRYFEEALYLAETAMANSWKKKEFLSPIYKSKRFNNKYRQCMECRKA